MHTRGDHDGPSYSDFFRPAAEVGDDGHFAVIARNCLAHDCFSDPVFALWLAQPLEMLGAVTVCVRVTMGKIDLVIIVEELDLESQSVVEAATLLLQAVLKVADVGTVSIPADALALARLCLLLGVEEWLHSLVVATLRLY